MEGDAMHHAKFEDATGEDEETLILTPVPALLAVLLKLEQDKGAALTLEEVEQARDRAECIAMPRHAHDAVVKARGYDDIDPERAWEQWLAFKAASTGA